MEEKKNPAEVAKMLVEEVERKTHEEEEAKRKAEWEARQAEKKETARKERERIATMNDDEVLELSMDKIEKQTERLTRRNMKICVMEHIQNKCFEDKEFRRLVMNPKKSMVNCFRYITQKAQEYIKEDMKLNGMDPYGMQGYGGDVPDDLCYQWAEEYFYDMNADVDRDKDDVYVPRKYSGSVGAASKSKAKKIKSEKEKSNADVTKDNVIPISKAGKKKDASDMEQMSLFDSMVI